VKEPKYFMCDDQSPRRWRSAVDSRREVLAGLTDDIQLLERVTGRSYADWLADTGRQAFSQRREVET
jgi:hypothetical protein